MSDTGVKCWGWNEAGKLGDGKLDYDSLLDFAGITDSNQRQLAKAYLQSILGWGDEASSARPVDVMVDASTRLTGVTQISAGSWHACALKDDGTVWCWGDNREGQLGDGGTSSSGYAVQVQGLPDPAQDPVVALAAGGGGRDPTVITRNPNDPNAVEDYAGGHSCALTQSGKVYCWGSNDRGQLGDGTTQDSSTPVLVSGL